MVFSIPSPETILRKNHVMSRSNKIAEHPSIDCNRQNGGLPAAHTKNDQIESAPHDSREWADTKRRSYKEVGTHSIPFSRILRTIQ